MSAYKGDLKGAAIFSIISRKFANRRLLLIADYPQSCLKN
jgi:hypothetical protein